MFSRPQFFHEGMSSEWDMFGEYIVFAWGDATNGGKML